MKNPMIILTVIGCLLNASAAISSQNRTLLQSIDDMLIEATLANGHRQILAANLSQHCETKALSNLATVLAESDGDMKCDTTTEIVQDIGAVLVQAFTSASSLIVDLNTIMNGVPLCFTTYSWINIFGILPCMFHQVGEIWTAMKDFYNYPDYINQPIAKAQELYTCFVNRQTNTVYLVQNIVNNAKYCN